MPIAIHNHTVQYVIGHDSQTVQLGRIMIKKVFGQGSASNNCCKEFNKDMIQKEASTVSLLLQKKFMILALSHSLRNSINHGIYRENNNKTTSICLEIFAQ